MSEVEISQTELVDAVTFLEQFLTSKLPQYDFSPGTANRDIAINAVALVFSCLRTDINTVKNSLTLFDLKDKTDATSNELVDAILSDYFITRNTGSSADGPVALYFSTNNIGTVAITNEALFIKNGIEYVTTSSVVFITAADLQTNTDNTGVTYYTYNLNLQAVEKGSEGRATPGLFTSWDVSSPFLYRVEALSDFENGNDIETSEDLIVRSEKALTVKNLVTQNAIYTVLMAEFSFLKNVYPVGMHEPEMTRDLITYTSGNTERTIHRGSMIDIYGKFPITFRSQDNKLIESVVINGVPKTAILMESIPIYKVRSIIDTGSNNVSIPFTVEVDDQSLYLSGRQKLYLVVSEDYLGSTFQVNYDFTTNYQEVQDYVSLQSERTVVADALVKAHFPLYLSFDMPVYATADIDEAAMKSTIQDFIHSGEVEGNLFVSSLIDKVTDIYGITVQLPFVITGNLLLPNGKTMVITFSDRVLIPPKYLVDDLGNYIPFYEGEINTNNYTVGLMSGLQISDSTTRYVLDKDDITVRRVT